MIIDVHTHICSPAVRNHREKYLRPTEVAFSTIYADPRARLAGVSELAAMMDEEGVAKSVAFGFPWVDRDTAMAENDYLLEAQTRHPGRVIGLACFDPLQPWGLKEAERALDAGLRGLGELAVYDAGFDREAIARFADLAALCRERNAPMLVHVNEPIGHRYPGKAPLTLSMIYDLVLACRGVKLVLAHWGGGLFFYHTLKREVPEALADVYFDTAASPYLYRPEIFQLAVRIVGAEKILLGTDYPLLKPGRYFREMGDAGLSKKVVGQIGGKSAAAIFS